MAGETDTSFVEFESMHRITFNISANTTETSTNIANGVNLWQVHVYGSLYMNGTGERYSETQIPIDDTSTVTAGSPVEYSGLVWNMDLTNFTCPSTNQFYMCVQLMPGDMPEPRFSMSPIPLETCVEIDCTGENTLYTLMLHKYLNFLIFLVMLLSLVSCGSQRFVFAAT